MKTQFLISLFCLSMLFNHAQAQQSKMNWTHVYKKSGTELIVTEFFSPADSVLLRYECCPDKIDYLESRSRPLNHGVVKDTTYISCPEIVKITATTLDSTYIDFVPQEMLRKLTKEENPDWIN